jgi:hypothetical protein
MSSVFALIAKVIRVVGTRTVGVERRDRLALTVCHLPLATSYRPRPASGG